MIDYDINFVKLDRDSYKLLAEHWEKKYNELAEMCKTVIDEQDNTIKELVTRLSQQSDKNANKEISKLKDLLKECFTVMEETQYWDIRKLLPKIEEALK